MAHSNAAWWMLGCLTATVAALTVLAVSAPPTVVVRAPTIAVAAPGGPSPNAAVAAQRAASAASAAEVHETADDAPTDPTDAPGVHEASVATESPKSPDAELPPDAPPKKARTSKRKRRTNKTARRDDASDAKPDVTPSPSSRPAAKQTSATSGGLPSVECVLEPAKCAASPPTPQADPGKASRTDGPLPDKLTIAQLRTGLASAKPAAKQCGRAHGIAAGVGVKIKLSIQGSGVVASATVLGEHANTALARCLTAAAKKATFPRFAKSVMGTVYTFRL